MHEHQPPAENVGQSTRNDLTLYGGPDLPVEVWTEILAYLPRGIAWKLIGLNRLLFKLGMDEIYDEIVLTDIDRRGQNVLEQIRHQSIAVRVRRLFIRPSFLPGINPDGNPVHGESHKSDYLKSVSSLLETALASIPLCSRLNEVTIVLHDHFLTPPFLYFLKRLLKQLAAQIKILKINVTPHSFHSISNLLPTLPGLTLLNIRFCRSRIQPRKWRASRMTKALAALVTSARLTLQTLVVDIATGFDTSLLFKRLPVLPSLRAVELRTGIVFDEHSNPKAFISFLQRNVKHLEHLAIGLSDLSFPDITLTHLIKGLFELRVSNIRELCLNLDTCLNTFILLDISSDNHNSFVPNLKKLVLEGPFSFLDGNSLARIMDNKPPHGRGALSLEVLQVRLPRFSPEYLEYFALLFPNLRSLDVRYYKAAYTAFSDQFEGLENPVYKRFCARRFPGWKLKNLRVAKFDACSEEVFDTNLIEAIASSLPSLDHMCQSSSCKLSCQDTTRWSV